MSMRIWFRLGLTLHAQDARAGIDRIKYVGVSIDTLFPE